MVGYACCDNLKVLMPVLPASLIAFLRPSEEKLSARASAAASQRICETADVLGQTLDRRIRHMVA